MTFYIGYNNADLIRVNYISDDSVAAAMNEACRTANKPLVASPCLMGGYRLPILEDIADGKVFQILKADIPKNIAAAASVIQDILLQPETLYSYADGTEVTIVQIEGYDRRATPLSSHGWQFTNGPKLFKRAKTLNRPFRIWAELDRPLRVAIVEDDAYVSDDLDLDAYTPEEIERLLDGAFVISPELYAQALENVEFPVFKDNVNSFEYPELMVDYYRSQAYLQQAQYFRAFNGRAFGPFHYIGIADDDPLHDRPGTLKGEAFKDVGGMCAKMHVDVICARSAIKFEVASTKKTFILLEPQKAKRSGVNSDLQTMINLPGVYQYDFIVQWVKEFLLTQFERLKNNEVMESWYDMSTPFFNSSSRFFEQNDVTTLTKWNVRAWLMSGRKITESPWLFEQMANAIAKSLQPGESAVSKLRFPIPCAVRAQVISASFASMAGYDILINPGCARWVEELEAIVVSDKDWLEMYRSHGGMDLDDFFAAYFRKMDGEYKIICVRSPNDWGEYTIFDYVEGDWYPSFECHDGSVMSFPEVPTDAKFWPKRLSECVADGDITYTHLPSDHDKTKPEPHPYSIGDVMNTIKNNKGSASCVGANVNSRSLHSLSVGQHRAEQLCPMEGAIDAGTQGGSSADTDAVHLEAKQIIETIIKSDVKIDEYMWLTRFVEIYGMPFDRTRLTNKTHVSQANKFRQEAARSFIDLARKYAQQELTKNFDPQINRLGKRLIMEAYNVLLETRRNMVRRQSGDQSMGLGDWRDVHTIVLEKMNMYEMDVEKHDFIMALYSACLRAPTQSTGKISDQLVMNPHVFPHLLNAMIFYGLADNVFADTLGNLRRERMTDWDLECQECHTVRTVQDPVLLQSYYRNNGICSQCRTLVAV